MNIPPEARLTEKEWQEAILLASNLTPGALHGPEPSAQRVIADAASAKAYRAACLEVMCEECAGYVVGEDSFGNPCPACSGAGKRLLTAADVARSYIWDGGDEKRWMLRYHKLKAIEAAYKAKGGA